MKPEIKTRRYFACPAGCDHEFSVEHLFSGAIAAAAGATRQAGPWYCDACGQAWSLTYDATTIVDVEPAHRGCGRKRKQWVTLELPPQTRPVRFKVLGMRFQEAIDEDSDRYFYEEHTCPTNWMRNVTEVEFEGDTDPHGLWHLVRVEEHAESPPAPPSLGTADPT
jgi:hypothetical protein